MSELTETEQRYLDLFFEDTRVKEILERLRRNKSYPSFVNSMFKEFPTEIETMLHTVVGISGEAGELIDAVKKSWVYNKPLDRENLKEELGDILFYLTKLASMLGVTVAELCELNRQKLEKRYPSGYSDKDAQERKDKQ
jgi:NTP pyrophosphatase (non-canonical NTP hydrolase)